MKYATPLEILVRKGYIYVRGKGQITKHVYVYQHQCSTGVNYFHYKKLLGTVSTVKPDGQNRCPNRLWAFIWSLRNPGHVSVHILIRIDSTQRRANGSTDSVHTLWVLRHELDSSRGRNFCTDATSEFWPFNFDNLIFHQWIHAQNRWNSLSRRWILDFPKIELLVALPPINFDHAAPTA